MKAVTAAVPSSGAKANETLLLPGWQWL